MSATRARAYKEGGGLCKWFLCGVLDTFSEMLFPELWGKQMDITIGMSIDGDDQPVQTWAAQRDSVGDNAGSMSEL